MCKHPQPLRFTRNTHENKFTPEEIILRVKKGILAILATCILAITSSTAFAEAKIGVSDAQRAILQSELGQQGLGQINAGFQEQEDLLKEMQKEITTLLEKLKKDTELMSDQEFQNLMGEISVKRNQLAQGLQQLQNIKLEQTDRLIQSLTPRYQEAIEALVLGEKYDLILPRQSTHYRHELYDVTAKITEKMNALEK
ncbi:MAG: outer membrane protein [Candidatus Azotimanducaceae bacterium]|jgi:outer membrane protein